MLVPFLAAAAIAIVGTFLPWVDWMGRTLNGIGGDGMIVLIAMGIAVLLAGIALARGGAGRGMWIAITIFTLAAAGIAGFVLMNVTNRIAQTGMNLSATDMLAYGYWISLAGSAIALILAIVGTIKGNKPAAAA